MPNFSMYETHATPCAHVVPVTIRITVPKAIWTQYIPTQYVAVTRTGSNRVKSVRGRQTEGKNKSRGEWVVFNNTV
jgi:hypothetical protein